MNFADGSLDGGSRDGRSEGEQSVQRGRRREREGSPLKAGHGAAGASPLKRSSVPYAGLNGFNNASIARAERDFYG